MKFRNLIAAATVAALTVTAHAATIIVPAAGTGAGANNSHWQSELTLHNAAPRAVPLSISFVRGTTVFGPANVVLPARKTESTADIVKNQFGLNSATGAIVIGVADREARSLAVTSRTFNVSANGEFGQDIPAVDATDALRTGDIAALNGASDIATTRFNFGVYVSDAASIDWELVRADGTVAATKNVTYTTNSHAQYNSGIETLLGAEPQDNDTVHAHVKSGRAIFYGSVINATGDPSFVPGIRTREDITINFTGVDLDENGSIDVRDNDGDGVLDTPVRITRSLFPNYFNVIAEGEFGEAVTLELVSAPGHTELLDGNTLIVIAGADVTGNSGEIVLKATFEGSSQFITIPLAFR
ncbi:MAG TPA: hypothetical protein VEK79_13695 [Thermoanaerobaculia bacterium]|nr:hypothetical protein [Thermoanaerobaculia bacterium]